MGWIELGLLVCIGLTLAPLLLLVALVFELLFLAIIGAPAIVAGIGYLISTSTGGDPLQGVFVGGGLGFGIGLVYLILQGITEEKASNEKG